LRNKILQNTNLCSSVRNLPINFSLKGQKTFKYHLWAEGTIMRSYRALARALANKNSDFLAIAKALVARNFVWALPKQKGTIK